MSCEMTGKGHATALKPGSFSTFSNPIQLRPANISGGVASMGRHNWDCSGYMSSEGRLDGLGDPGPSPIAHLTTGPAWLHAIRQGKS